VDLINEILKWSLACVLVIQAYILIFHRGVPNIKTAAPCRRLIAQTLKRELKERGIENPTIIDLGSGKGALTTEVAKALPSAHIIGYEFSALSVQGARKKAENEGLDNIEYRRENFFKADLGEADAIIFYQNAETIPALTEKLEQEKLKEGTLVLSNRFPLRGKDADQVMEAKTRAFKQGKVHLYRL